MPWSGRAGDPQRSHPELGLALQIHFAVGLAGPVAAITPAGLAPPIPPWECDLKPYTPLAILCFHSALEGSRYSPLTLRAAGDPIAAPPARPKIPSVITIPVLSSLVDRSF